MVVSPPPVRAVRPHRVLRQLARPARHRPRRSDRTSLDHQLRGGSTLVIRLSRPTVLRRRPPTCAAGPSPTGISLRGHACRTTTKESLANPLVVGKHHRGHRQEPAGVPGLTAKAAQEGLTRVGLAVTAISPYC